MKNRILVLVIMLLPVCAEAHDTNVTHPRITEQAVNVIKAIDEQNADDRYMELYREDGAANDLEYKRINWGNDPRLNEDDAVDDAGAEFARFRKVRRNVLDGVVMEDNPLSVVLRHFYNPYSGDPVTLNSVDVSGWTSYLGVGPEINTSKTAGIRFFDQAIELFGYDAEGVNAYETAFWLYGHSLHHLEDMNSIAHVQGDVHLTHGSFDSLSNWIFEERDDFEANYIPTMLWSTSLDPEIAGLFEVKKIAPVTDFAKIWPSPIPSATSLITGEGGALAFDNLARSTYNLAAFQGTLEQPESEPPSGGSPSVPSSRPTNECGEGELAEMFNDSGEATCRLYWEKGLMGIWPRWVIDGVGVYEYSDSVEDANDDWWELTEFNGPSGYYYIEQLMRGIGRGEGKDDVWIGEGDPFEASNMVVPHGRRQNFAKAWGEENPVVANTNGTPLLKLIAHEVLPLGVEYAAGYTQWWYQIANTPPFLKKVEIYQHGSEAGVKGDLKYSAEWQNAIAERNVYLLNETGLGKHRPIPVRYVRARNLKHHIDKVDSLYLTEEGDIDLYLEFNEPIKDPRDPGSGFEIRIGGYAVTPALIEPADSAMSYPNGPWFEGRRWKVSIRQSSLVDPNGKVPLTVQAMDRNPHWNGPGNTLQQGLGLDQDPGTPARRQRRAAHQPAESYSESGPGSQGWLDYPWHDDQSYDINFQDNVANPDHRMKPGDFAYDNSGNGDRTHYLIFDNEKPKSQSMEGSVQDPPDA